jgi:WD40 repeat protein
MFRDKIEMIFHEKKLIKFFLLIFLFGPLICQASQNLKQITTDKAHDYHVKWSPDGKTLAFTSQRDGEPEIWLVQAQWETEHLDQVHL